MQLRGFSQPRYVWFDKGWSCYSTFERFHSRQRHQIVLMVDIRVCDPTLTKPLCRWIPNWLEAFCIYVTRDNSFLDHMVLNSIFSSSLAGAPLKVCPQGFSCCTVEMEEKLSQQSHTEIKAPVSRLSTNLQSTFKQRHDHFDSKKTHWAQTNTSPHCAAS